jgi:hypothetical protein
MNGRSGSRMVLRPVYGEKRGEVMAKSKKGSKKPSVKVEDLQPEADPKGGSLNFSKIETNKLMYKDLTASKFNTGIKIDGTTSILDSSLKFLK